VFRFGKAKPTRTERLRLNAMRARHRAAETAYKAQAMAGPTVEKAGNVIAPKVSAARTKVTDDLMPLALAIMAAAAERSRPTRTEAKARSIAMWRALLGDYPVPEPPRSHRVRNAALTMGGLSAAAIAGLAATRRSRGPEWMQNGSDEPYATAAQPRNTSQDGISRLASDDAAGASPDEAIADQAETAGTDR